jgi:hypothetical protein
MSVEANSRRTILLTGASLGLGLAISRILLETDHHLILTARASSLKRFEAAGITESERVWLRPLDVTVAQQREEIVEEASERLGGVDVLINNAGISFRSVIEHVSDEERLYQMAVNYSGPLSLTKLVLPAMRKKRAGRIIQISSAGGFMAMPTMGVYAASKFALEGATEALYYEMRPFGVKVSLILPGFINSDGFQRVVHSKLGEVAAGDPKNPYFFHYDKMSSFVGRVMQFTPSTPERVARSVVRTMNARWPKLRVPATWDARVLWMVRRLLPQRLYHEVLYQLLPEIQKWAPSEDGSD